MFQLLSQHRLLALTLVYYVSLYFSTSNRTILLFTGTYWFFVYRLTKNFSLSLFVVFIATLPFPKGKAYHLVLLSKDLISRYALYDISYFFPVYISDLFLALFGYVYIRKKFYLQQWQLVSKNILLIIFVFVLFVIWVLFGGLVSVFPEIGVFSTMQLLRMLVIVSIPFMISRQEFAAYRGYLFSVAIALLLFESGWTLLQRFAGGPLGKDIEVYLPGAQYGIFSSENSSLLRNTGTFFEPSILGTFLLMQMGILLPFLWNKIHVNLKSINAFAMLVGTIALVFTGSRILYGIWLILTIGVIFMKYKVDPNSLQRIKKGLSWRTIIICFSILLAIVPYILQRASSLTDVFSQYGSASYRIQMIIYSMRLSSENLLTGIGINLSPYYLATGFIGERYVFDPTYPHNLIAQLLAETGIVGASLFLVFLALLFRFIFRDFQLKRYYGFAIAALVYIVSAQFYPIFLNHTELSSFFFLYAGFAMFERMNHG